MLKLILDETLQVNICIIRPALAGCLVWIRSSSADADREDPKHSKVKSYTSFGARYYNIKQNVLPVA